MKAFTDIHPSVEKALSLEGPVVALESTIISHGMPYPQNAETALEVESIIRNAGCIPATIGILEGRIKVGLQREEIYKIGRAGRSVIKTNRRDLPAILSQKLLGATTVAGTMVVAHAVGIRVMATGGIGGVHRGVADTMDISADLMELSKSNVAVVCAGMKFILDLKRTMEYLETLSVPVIGYATRELPAFYTTKSGIFLDLTMNGVDELANFCTSKWKMGLGGGVVIANPIPAESELSKKVLDQAVDKALEDAEKRNITGKDVTPFLLSQLEGYTHGTSLKANIELIYNNARLASDLATKLGSGCLL